MLCLACLWLDRPVGPIFLVSRFSTRRFSFRLIKEYSSVPVPMELSRVIVSEINDQQAIYLRECGGARMFPILIGPFEAQIINRRLLEETPFRPLTHDLLRQIIETLGGQAEEVVITDMREHTYYAVLKVRVGDKVHEVDCRPSDAVALAVHYRPHLPISVAEHVLETSG
jgi:bifunctional DNase/RNase